MKTLFNISALFLCSFVYGVLSHKCLDLEAGNLENFDTKKLVGGYQLVMGVLGDPLTLLTINCNDLTLKHHAHPRGGINLAIYFESADADHSIQLQFMSHSNSSDDPLGEELAHYNILIDEWMDLFYRTLHVTDDVLVTVICIRDEDNEENETYFVLVMRRNESKMSISEVRDSLPDSIRNLPQLEITCDQEYRKD